MLNPERSLNRRFIDRLATAPALDAIARVVQPVVGAALDAGGIPVKNALSGTWLGHPLHPAITDVPIGAWTVTAILDALSLAGKPEANSGADFALVIGIAGGVASTSSGWADWSTTKDEPQRVGLAHAILNGGALALYAASLAARKTGRRGAGIALGFEGYAVVSLAAYLGGELSFGMHLGVRHTAEPIVPADDFVPVIDESALEPGKPTRVELEGIPVLLVRTDAGVFALGAACTHRGAPLDEGELEGDCIRCPWHGARFAIADGAVVEGPASFPQPRFETRIRDGRVELRPLPVAVTTAP